MMSMQRYVIFAFAGFAMVFVPIGLVSAGGEDSDTAGAISFEMTPKFEPAWRWGTLLSGEHGYTQVVRPYPGLGAEGEGYYITEEFLPKYGKGITIPRFFTKHGAYTGDYKAKGYQKISLELRTFIEPGYPEPLPICVTLYSSKWVAYDCGEFMPRDTDGWIPYVFSFATDSEHLPAGWAIFSINDIGETPSNPDATWKQIIGNVEQLAFHFGPPDYFYFTGNAWSVAARSIVISVDK